MDNKARLRLDELALELIMASGYKTYELSLFGSPSSFIHYMSFQAPKLR